MARIGILSGVLFLCSAAAALGACTDKRSDGGMDDGSGGLLSAGSGASASAGDGDAEASASAGDGDGDGGDKLDVGGASTASGGGDDGELGSGCLGVDFLFVIDNSLSMEDEQAQLISSFPGFVDTITNTLQDDAQDFHVMVVDTDGGGDPGCIDICTLIPDATCNGMNCQDILNPTGCHIELGSGRTEDGDGQSCGIVGGQRFMTSAQPDIGATFGCLGNVGINGSGAELPMDAMMAAVGNQAADGSCNQGFLRDDAILVVTVITDEEDNPDDELGGSVGSPQDWVNALVAAKGNNPAAVVVLGLFGDNDLAGGICAPLDPNSGFGAEASPRLRSFVELFGDQGLFGTICAPSYVDFFDSAVSLIDTTCDDFIPEG